MTPPSYVPPENWYQWPDGTRTCWWCAALVHPAVADIHDRWHRKLEGAEPVATRPDESGIE
jgi:hypothetical protein